MDLSSLLWHSFVWAPRGLFTTVTGSYVMIESVSDESQPVMEVDVNFVQPHRGAFIYTVFKNGMKDFSRITITLKAGTPRSDVVFSPILREKDWADYEPKDWWLSTSPYGNVANSTRYLTYVFPRSAFVPAGYSSDENGRLDPQDVLWFFIKFDTVPPGRPLEQVLKFFIREVKVE